MRRLSPAAQTTIFLACTAICAFSVIPALALDKPQKVQNRNKVIAMSAGQLEDWKTYAKSGSESFAIGDFAAAETKFRSALTAADSDSSARKALPDLQVKYTNALMSQGKFQLAAKELKKTLSLAKSISGTECQDYAEALDLQSWLYQVNGKMQPAIKSLEDSIATLEQKAPDSSDLADAYEHMGLLQETTGIFEAAKDNYSKALAIRQKLSPNGVEVADMYEALAHVAQRRGQQADVPQLYANAMRIKESRGEPWKPFAPEPTDRVVMFHFFAGAPNCKQASSEGTLIESMSANGITVEAGISQVPSEFAKTTRALVRISNQSQYDIDLLPQPPTFIQITPGVKILKPLNAQELASKIEKKGESKAKWIKFWGADAMTSVNSYSYTQGRGAMPVYAYVPSSFGWSAPAAPYGAYSYTSMNQRGRSFSSSTNTTAMVPDYQARAEAYRKAAEATNKSKQDADAIRDSALGPNRLPSGGQVQGSLDFELSKYQSAILRIPIGNAIYEFRFQ